MTHIIDKGVHQHLAMFKNANALISNSTIVDYTHDTEDFFWSTVAITYAFTVQLLKT